MIDEAIIPEIDEATVSGEVEEGHVESLRHEETQPSDTEELTGIEDVLKYHASYVLL